MNQGWIVCAGACVLGGLEVVRELTSFRVRRYAVEAPVFKDNQMRIVFLSDLHGKSYGLNNEKLLNAVRKEKPHYILVGGDMLIRSEPDSINQVLDFMEALSNICPVYCANGNHEQQMKQYPKRYHGAYEAYRNKLLSFGIRMVENASVSLTHKGVPVTISGLELPLSYYGHFKELPLFLTDIQRCIGKPDKDRYQILMAHTPVYMEQYKRWGADLTLSGHLHGGIVRIPGIGGVITPQVRLFPKYSGDMYLDDTHCGIVSRGLGNHTVNIRFLNMAELVSVVLQ